jgi:hypothetical protein
MPGSLLALERPPDAVACSHRLREELRRHMGKVRQLIVTHGTMAHARVNPKNLLRSRYELMYISKRRAASRFNLSA